MRRTRGIVVGFLAASAFGASGWAQSDVDARIEQGIELREAHRDEEALRVFREVFESSHSSRALVQVALAEQALGRWADAETHLSDAIGDARDRWVRHHRAALAASLAEIRQHVGELDVLSSVPGATLVIGDRVVGTLPLTAPVHVPTGSVTLTVRAEGYAPVTRTVVISAQITSRETVTPTAVPAAPVVVATPVPTAPSTTAPPALRNTPPTAPLASQVVRIDPAVLAPAGEEVRSPRMSPMRTAGIVLLAAGGASIVAWGALYAVGSGLAGGASDATPSSADPYGAWARFQANVNYARTLSASDVCNQAAGASGSDAQQVRDLCSQSNALRPLQSLTLVAGGVLAATGLVLTIVGRPRAEARASRFEVTPMVARGLGGAVLRVAF